MNSTNSRWVDFKELRAKLDFAAVLRSYQVELKVKGERATGFCPLPSHQGKRRSPSFSAHLARGIFQCFGCGAKGDVIRYVAYQEGFDPDSHEGIRKAALLLQDRFFPAMVEHSPPPPSARVMAKPRVHGNAPAEGHKHPREREAQEGGEAQKSAGRGATRPAIVNAPLDFRLQGIASDHPYLKARGLTTETIEHFALGYCSRGLMQGRIAIPLLDNSGQLIGYAGRLVDDSLIDAETPRYKFPSTRERGGAVYEFRKSLFLYNGFHVPRPARNLIVVEGFASVWWLWQCGFPDVVALMGSSCSSEQARLIVETTAPDGRVWVFTDGDKAGERCAEELFFDLTPHRLCRWVKLPEGQPTDRTPEQLKALLCCEALPEGGAA